MQRRDLFSFGSKLLNKEKGQPFVVRPPYLEDISKLEVCANCQTKSCEASCEERIIFIDKVGKPYLSFESSGCIYCDECAKACESEVLKTNQIKINARFEIDMLSCLSWNQTMCYSCKDKCLDDAISFIGLFRPSMDDAKCTSCGFCVGVCPTNSVKIGEKI